MNGLFDVPNSSRRIEVAHPVADQQPRPLLLHIGDAFSEPDYPSATDPMDDSWLRLDPVRHGAAAAFILHHTYRRAITESIIGVPRTLHARPSQDPDVHTFGPFKGDRAVVALRAAQQRPLSLTFAAPERASRVRFFNVRAALDVELRYKEPARFWLDFTCAPVGVQRITHVHTIDATLERTA